jgi:hypothetical protein
MAAPTNTALVKKALANSEPSTHGPSRTFLVSQRTSALEVCVQPVSATPLAVYRLAFGSPRSFADVD